MADGTEDGTVMSEPVSDVDTAPGMVIFDRFSGALVLGNFFQITPNGLQVTGKPTHEADEDMGRTLNVLEGALQLSLGDYLNHIEKTRGEDAGQYLDASEGWAESTRRNYAWVAKKVPVENRMIPPLTFSHLQAVAELTHKSQRTWLEKAVTGDGTNPWPVSKLKMELLAATEGGKKRLTFYLIVDCGTEAKQTKLAGELEKEGLSVIKRSGINRMQKKAKSRAKPPKAGRKEKVTARRRRAGKITTRRRLTP